MITELVQLLSEFQRKKTFGKKKLHMCGVCEKEREIERERGRDRIPRARKNSILHVLSFLLFLLLSIIV